jgi:hypothetical protein
MREREREWVEKTSYNVGGGMRQGWVCIEAFICKFKDLKERQTEFVCNGLWLHW